MHHKPTMMDVTRVIEHTMCEMTVKGFMGFSLDGVDVTDTEIEVIVLCRGQVKPD
jgi:hypothetical protein